MLKTPSPLLPSLRTLFAWEETQVTFFTGLYKVCAWDFIVPAGGYAEPDVPVGFRERLRRHRRAIGRTYARLRRGGGGRASGACGAGGGEEEVEEEEREAEAEGWRGGTILGGLKRAVGAGFEKGEANGGGGGSMADAFQLAKVDKDDDVDDDDGGGGGGGKKATLTTSTELGRLTARPLALTTSITRQLSAAETESISCAPYPPVAAAPAVLSGGGGGGSSSSSTNSAATTAAAAGATVYQRGRDREGGHDAGGGSGVGGGGGGQRRQQRLEPIPASRAHSPTHPHHHHHHHPPLHATRRSPSASSSRPSSQGTAPAARMPKHLAVLGSIGSILKSIVTPVTTSLLLALVCALVPPLKSLFVDGVEGWSGTRMSVSFSFPLSLSLSG